MVRFQPAPLERKRSKKRALKKVLYFDVFNFTVPEKSKESMNNALVNKHGNNPPPVPPRTNQSHHVTTTYITQDEVTVSGASMSGATSLQTHPDQQTGVQIAVITNSSGEPPKKKNEILKLREMLLSDNSVESS